MGKIILKNIAAYAYHGCLSEETKIGSDYLVNMCVHANLKPSAKSDDLSDTVDYVLLNKIVKEEMAIPSKLLEHVANRILNRVFESCKMVTKATVSVSKLNPPIYGNVENVTVRLCKKRKK